MPTYVVSGTTYTGEQSTQEIQADSIDHLLTVIKRRHSTRCNFTLNGSQLRATLFEGTVTVKLPATQELFADLCALNTAVSQLLPLAQLACKANEVHYGSAISTLKNCNDRISATLNAFAGDLPITPEL